ncbi:pyridoxamine 5'-phosphate oxidase family protein [Georgenia halophila]|uniref:Pyridoxamine 5'-phosphate oxidase family protein n=1 Tax=Georgenia halophila TaxID=620889 RepID=A0ABP8LKB9_9MICO
MALSKDDREQFLAEPRIGALSVAGEEGRGPVTVPIWFHYTPGGPLWVLTEADSRKVKLIRAAGRFTIMADRKKPSLRYVSVEGPVTRIEPGTEDDLRAITYRYLSGESAEKYLDFARTELGAEVVVEMRPERWLSADLG